MIVVQPCVKELLGPTPEEEPSFGSVTSLAGLVDISVIDSNRVKPDKVTSGRENKRWIPNYWIL